MSAHGCGGCRAVRTARDPVTFTVEVTGLEALRELQEIKGRVGVSAVRAINKVARDQRSNAAKKIREQVAFQARTLGPSSGRLFVSRKASRNRLEARITARSRPTSLARFTPGRSTRQGVRVEIKPGRVRFLRRAFFIRLPQGASLTDTKFNLGLAIRLRPGERLSNKIRQVQLGRNLVLLYGPSIQQIFLDNEGKGVAADISTQTADQLEAEFARLLGVF